MAKSAAWIDAFRGDAEPVVYAKISVDGSTTFHSLSKPCTVGATDSIREVSLVDVEPIRRQHDPFERKTTVGGATVSIAGWHAREFAVANELRGKKLEILSGTTALALSAFEAEFTGVIEDYKWDSESEVLKITGVDLFTLTLTKRVRTLYSNEFPLEVIKQLLIDGGYPSSLINSTQMAPSSYSSSFSHYVVDMTSQEVVIQRTQPSNWLGGVTEENDEITGIAGEVHAISALLPGMLTIAGDGEIGFKEYDDSAAAVRHLTTSDYSNLKQVDTSNLLMTRCRVNVMNEALLGGEQEGFYEEQNTDAETALAWPGEASRQIIKEISSKWLRGASWLQADITDVQTSLVVLGSISGMCGTRAPKTGSFFPTGTIAAPYTVTSTRYAYLMIDSEIVKVTAHAFSDQYFVQDVINTDGDSTVVYAPALATATVARGQLGTTAAAHVAEEVWTEDDGQKRQRNIVFDITIPVAMAKERLRRFSSFCPAIEFRTTMLHGDLDVGDFISLDSDQIVGKGFNGISSANKFEIISKTFDPFGDDPGYIFKALYVRTDSYTLNALFGRYFPSGIKDFIRDASRDADLFKGHIVKGLALSDAGGLRVGVAEGILGIGTARGKWRTRAVHLVASKYSHLYGDPLTGAIFVKATASATDPGADAAEHVYLGYAQTGASTISSIDELKENYRAFHGTRLVNSTVGFDSIDKKFERSGNLIFNGAFTQATKG